MPSTTPKLLIIGNGFDRQCGLSSDYEAFFRHTILDESGKTPRIKKEVSGFWEELLFGYYIVYKNTDYKWSDVETIIKDTLWTICFGENKSESNLMYGIWYKAIECINCNLAPEEYADRTNKINGYLFKNCHGFYFSRAAQIKLDYTTENLQVLLKYLLQELHSFERRFCKYLKENLVNPQDGQLNKEYIIKAVNLIAKLTGFPDRSVKDINSIITRATTTVKVQLTPTQHVNAIAEANVLTNEFPKLRNTNILSFNYTTLFDLLKVESPCPYSNVHGKLCNHSSTNDCTNSSIIFGIDDNLIKAKDSYSGLRIFSKTYRKMFDTSAPTSILPLKNVPLTIMFYGHSLSEADYSYFQSIFDYYDLYSNSKINLIFYYSEGHEQTDAIYQLINTYGQSLSNKDQGKNLIHKLLLENRLKIEKVL